MARRRPRWSLWPEYVPVAERRRQADAVAASHRARGRHLDPVETAGGRAITRTAWGTAWGVNLERCCDPGRLTRGRSYVRNGSVFDLQIGPGSVDALVSGSSVYTVQVRVKPLPAARWRQICTDCTGAIESVVELLQGRIAAGVMRVLTAPGSGILPEPTEVSVGCTCPDWAVMCKHVVAVLLGIGVRLDERPELLFTLRQVEPSELVAAGAAGLDTSAEAAPLAPELEGEDLGALFGIDLAEEPAPRQVEAPPPAQRRRPAKAARPAKTARAEKAPRAAKAARAEPAVPAKAPRKTRPEVQPKRQRRTRTALDPWITAAELRSRGVPAHVFQAWLYRGVLEHSGERGIYVRTPAVEDLVHEYVTRRAR